MRYMGGWSYEDLCNCPGDVLMAVIADMEATSGNE